MFDSRSSESFDRQACGEQVRVRRREGGPQASLPPSADRRRSLLLGRTEPISGFLEKRQTKGLTTWKIY